MRTRTKDALPELKDAKLLAMFHFTNLLCEPFPAARELDVTTEELEELLVRFVSSKVTQRQIPDYNKSSTGNLPCTISVEVGISDVELPRAKLGYLPEGIPLRLITYNLNGRRTTEIWHSAGDARKAELERINRKLRKIKFTEQQLNLRKQELEADDFPPVHIAYAKPKHPAWDIIGKDPVGNFFRETIRLEDATESKILERACRANSGFGLVDKYIVKRSDGKYYLVDELFKGEQ